MRKSTLLKNALIMALAAAMPMSVQAMPTDIEELVTSGDYDAYDAQNDYVYDDADLIYVGANYVATGAAMIRTAPFGEIIGSLVVGETYYVIGQCPDCMWYKISTGSGSGYSYMDYLVPAGSYSSSSGNSGSGYNIHELDIMMTVTSASSVNVRSLPSTSGSVVGVAYEGEDVQVTGNVLGTEWYEVEFDGETAYICDDYLTPDLPQTLACTAGTLNIRDSASSNGGVIAAMNYGDKVRVSEMDGDWYRISLSDGTIGYVYDEYMAVVQ